MVAISHVLFALAGIISVQATPAGTSTSCAAEQCFRSPYLPAKYTPLASAFCQLYIRKVYGTVTKTTTVIATATSTKVPGVNTALSTKIITPAVTTIDQTTVITVPAAGVTSLASTVQIVTVGTVCTTTVSTTLLTAVAYPTRSANNVKIRADVIPAELSSGCRKENLNAKISAACSCFLTSKTITKTSTSTVTATVTGLGQSTTVAFTTTLPVVTVTRPVVITQTLQPVTIGVTVTQTSNTQLCTSTSTKYVYSALSCGIASPTIVAAGSISCTDAAPAGQTNARFRIEGGSQGTIFEDCIASGPKSITTPSGGTHQCDGTNGGANPSPGATLTTQIDAAANLGEFTFDGSYSNSFQDFFITRIAETSQTSNQFWGVLRDLVFTSRGGCQELSTNGPEGLWAFDAFNANSFLKLDPEYQVVRAGSAQSVTLTVRQASGNGGALSPAGGATVGGATSDANGNVVLAVPTVPGCYQYKATRSGSIRSNAFYLTVLPADG